MEGAGRSAPFIASPFKGRCRSASEAERFNSGRFVNRPYGIAVAKIGAPWGHDYRSITCVPPRYAAKASPGICLWDDMQTGVGSKGGAVSTSPSLGRFFFPYSF